MAFEIFKQYDVRGAYPSRLDETEVSRVMRIFPVIWDKKTRIIIGHDARKSSPSLYKTAVGILGGMGYSVVPVGMITTPMITFLVERPGSSEAVGVMITASHNPKNQNGIKIISKRMGIVGGIDLLERMKEHPLGEERDDGWKRRVVVGDKSVEAKKEYAKFLEKFFGRKTPERKVRIVIDCSNGSAGPILRKIKFPAHIRPIFLNEKPDGNFPTHGPNPLLERALVAAKKAVKKHRADCGAVLDGDGDRAVFIDDEGATVRPEYAWRLIVGNRTGRAVVTELNAYLVKKLARDMNLRKPFIHISRVGRKYIMRKMRKSSSETGFENSGHYYFKDFFGGDSGIVAVIKVANALSVLPYSFSDFIRFLPHTTRLPEKNIRFSGDGEKLFKIAAKQFGKKVERVSSLEGISLRFVDGFLNMRLSNTEGVIRINSEGENAEKTKQRLAEAVGLVRSLENNP